MKIEHVSANLFTIELRPVELDHLLSISRGNSKRMLQILSLWCEIGFFTSTAIERNLDEQCKSKNSQRINFS